MRGKPVVDIQKLNLNKYLEVFLCSPQITWIMQEKWMFSSLQRIDWTSMDWWETSKKPWWFHRSFYPSQMGKFIFCEVNLHWFHKINNWKLPKKTRSNHLLILKFHFFSVSRTILSWNPPKGRFNSAESHKPFASRDSGVGLSSMSELCMASPGDRPIGKKKNSEHD